MGFEPQIRKIVGRLPSERQTLMFTATWPSAVRKLASEFLRAPVQVTIGDSGKQLTANKDIVQVVEVLPSAADRDAALVRHINGLSHGARVIIFCSTKRACDQLSNAMARQIGCSAIHGDKDQRERERTLADFRSGRAPILVATDVAARGLDIKDVRLVVNYEFPPSTEDYIHRIGRTGRAGADGLAVTLMTAQDAKHAGALIKILQDSGQRVPDALRALAASAPSKAGPMVGGEGSRLIGPRG